MKRIEVLVLMLASAMAGAVIGRVYTQSEQETPVILTANHGMETQKIYRMHFSSNGVVMDVEAPEGTLEIYPEDLPFSVDEDVSN